MTVRYVYKGTIIAGGNLQAIPKEGNFVEFQSINEIFRVNAVMFKALSNGDIVVMIYLCDVMENTEKMLRNYK